MADVSALIERILADDDLPEHMVTQKDDEQMRAVLARHLGARQSGDRVLPPPYDAMSAGDREAWLVYEGLFDGAITDDVRRANVGHPMASWAELKPEAHQALVTVLGQVILILHAVALNPEARRAGE